MCALVLSILAGLVSGSLALYTKDAVVSEKGSVIAKQFTITAKGTEGYEENVLIAPSEPPVTAFFTVSNFDGEYKTETPMDLSITVTLGAAEDKELIPYISARLLKRTTEGGVVTDTPVGNTISNGQGTITYFEDHAFAANNSLTNTYIIELKWEDHDVDATHLADITYEGHNHGNAYTVTVTGIQDIGEGNGLI